MPATVSTPVAAGWTRSMEFAARCITVAAMVLIMLFGIRPMAAAFTHLGLAGRVGLVVLMLIQVTIYIFMLTAANTLHLDVVVTLFTAAALVLYLAHQLAGPQEPGWWPTSAVHGVQLYLLAFGRSHQWALGGSAVVLFAALRLVATVHTGDPVGLGLVEVIVGLQLSLTAVLAVRASRQMAAEHDRVESERAEALLAQRAQEQEERHRQEVNRFLHDEVIHSLRAVALPPDRAPVGQVREAAARTAARLRQGQQQRWPAGPAGEIGVRLGQRAAELGLQASVNGRLPGVPEDVAEALERAGAEALRNVSRHAGTDRVAIRLMGRRGRIMVSIIDDGCGFDSSQLGNGLRDSVLARMTEIGGAATVCSGPQGTTVTLAWAPPSTQEQVERAWADLTRALNPIVWPGIVGLPLTVMLMLPQVANKPLMLAGLFVVTAVAVLAAVWPDRRLPPIALPVLVSAGVLGVLTNYLAVPPSTDNGYHLLMAGGVSYLLILVAIHFATRWAVLGALIIWVTVVGLGVWRFGPVAMVGPLVGATTGPVLGVALVPVKSVLRWVARRTLRARDATIRSRISITDSARRSDADDERLECMRQRVLPLLAAVADGRVDLADPATTSRALALEAAVRQELRCARLPYPMLAAANRSRGLGWQLGLRFTDEQAAGNAAAVVHLLDALGPPAGSGPVVLSAFGEPAAVVQSPSFEAVQRWRTRDDLSVQEAEEWCRLLIRTRTALEVPEGEGSREQRRERTLVV